MLALALASVRLNATDDVLAIDFSVVAIPAPPAAETVTAAQLKQILARQLRKKRKK